MNYQLILENSFWAALFAISLGIILTTPVRALIYCFVCGFIGRFVRDISMGLGMSQNWSTVIASTLLVIVAVAIVKQQRVSPVILICSVLPLGSVVALFNMIIALMKAASLNGEELSAVTDAFISNSAKVFTGTLSIALGLGLGMAIVRFLKMNEVKEVYIQINKS